MISTWRARTMCTWAVGAAGLALAGCDQIGSPIDAVQGKLPAPDEFEVLASKPLQMPQSLTLPEPRLGARSPLEPDPTADAAAALLGADGVTVGATVGATVSDGEAALLGATNASAAETGIRQSLASDALASDSTQPYEPPSLLELISGGDAVDLTEAIDPAEEARRLQTAGVAAAPVDPNAVPEAEPAEPVFDSDRQRGASYPSEGGRSPNNQLNKGGETQF